MKKKSNISHRSVGFFVIAAGVVSLSSIISSFQVLAAVTAPATSSNEPLSFEQISESALFPGLPQSTNEIPVTIDVAPSWKTVSFPHAPNAIGQPVTYIRVTSQRQVPIQLEEFGFVLKTNTSFDGAVALVKIPDGNALDSHSAFGFGLPEERAVTSTVAMSPVEVDAGEETRVTLPFVTGTILAPEESAIFAVTLDNAPSDEELSIEASVLGVTWKNLFTNQYFSNENVMFAAPRVTFTPEE